MLIPISNIPRDYAWGSSSLIAEMQGRVPSGAPEAEIWFGDHPGSPSTVDDGSGRTLDVALRDAGIPPLPYLLKVLAAATSLSIQAHPSRAEAIAGFAREEAAGIARDAADRTYRDDNHKPEIIVALSDVFRALVGLRPLTSTRRLLDTLGDSAGVSTLRDALAGASGEDDTAILRRVLAWALSGEATSTVDDLGAALTDAGARDESGEFAPELAVLARIAAEFPGDSGLIVALLMNLVELRRGEALFAPAGVLHAYQDGLGVELMAASDNVLRGGLTPKHIDVPELMSVVDTTPAAAPIVAADAVAPGLFAYDAGVADFRLVRAEVDAASPARVVLTGIATVLVTRGSVDVVAEGARISLSPGQAAVVNSPSVVLEGAGEAFVAQPGAV